MQLMACLMEHFRQRGGQALFLGTGYDTPPYHIYRVNGFAGVEPESGYMDYYSTSQDEFERGLFRAGFHGHRTGWLAALARFDSSVFGCFSRRRARRWFGCVGSPLHRRAFAAFAAGLFGTRRKRPSASRVGFGATGNPRRGGLGDVVRSSTMAGRLFG